MYYEGSTASGVSEIREELEKLGINIPNKASDFTIVACNAVATALGRALQKPDTAYDIVKELKVINEENKYTEDFKILCQNRFGDIAKTIIDLKNRATSIQGLSREKQELIEQITSAALMVGKAAATAAGPEKQATETFEG